MNGRMVALPPLARPLALVAAAVLAVLVLVGPWADPAAAHAELLGTEPTAGAQADQPVEQVTLRFTKPVGLVEGGITLLDDGGRPVPVAEIAQPSATEVVVRPVEALTAGSFGLRWSVQATDTHRLADTLTFAVGGASPAPAALDAALASAAPDTTVADGLGWLTRLAVYAGVLFAVGGLVYLVFVHEGTTAETRRIVFWIRRAALVVVVATAGQVLAELALAHDGSFASVIPLENWGHAFGNQAGLGLVLAALGGLTILGGMRMSIEQVERDVPLGDGTGPATGAARLGPGRVWDEDTGFELVPIDEAAGTWGRVALAEPVLAPTVRVQVCRVRVADSGLALFGAALVVASFLFLGHTASEGPRLLMSVADAMHVAAAATWSAGVALLAACLWRRRQEDDPLPGALLVARFARLATAALVVVAVSGLVLGVVILPGLSSLWTTPFGLLLSAKTAVVAAVAGLGAANHFRLVPALEADPHDGEAVRHLRQSVLAEAFGFAVVVALTAALVAASPT